MRRKKKTPQSVSIPIAPMIDCVFLLLVYFITTSSMKKSEADLGFELPSSGKAVSPISLQTKQKVGLNEKGNPIINNYQFPTFAEDRFAELSESLSIFKQTCLAAKKECEITISPDPNCAQQSIVYLLDTLAKIGIENLSFDLD